jgi:hypothetical protein
MKLPPNVLAVAFQVPKTLSVEHWGSFMTCPKAFVVIGTPRPAARNASTLRRFSNAPNCGSPHTEPPLFDRGRVIRIEYYSGLDPSASGSLTIATTLSGSKVRRWLRCPCAPAARTYPFALTAQSPSLSSSVSSSRFLTLASSAMNASRLALTAIGAPPSSPDTLTA